MNAETQGRQLPQNRSGFLFAGCWVSTQMCGAQRGGPPLDCPEESPKEIIQFPAVKHLLAAPLMSSNSRQTVTARMLSGSHGTFLQQRLSRGYLSIQEVFESADKTGHRCEIHLLTVCYPEVKQIQTAMEDMFMVS